jgi:hypothetical protein
LDDLPIADHITATGPTELSGAREEPAALAGLDCLGVVQLYRFAVNRDFTGALEFNGRRALLRVIVGLGDLPVVKSVTGILYETHVPLFGGRSEKQSG